MICPYCYGQGEQIEQSLDGFKLKYTCVFCFGKGKLNIVKYLYYKWSEKRYDIHNKRQTK